MNPTTPAPQSTPATPTPPNPSTIKVLIIDDDPSLSSLYKMTFMAEGIQVLTASDGVEGLKVARENRPNVIFLDIMMPNMDGKEFLRQAKVDPQISTIPVIVLSALMEELEKDEVMKLGATDYLNKNDASPETLMTKVHEVVSH